MRWRPLVLIAVLLAAGAAGCIGATVEGEGYVVTGQPMLDAFDRMDARGSVVGMPDWAIVDDVWAAQRVGRPFSIDAESVIRLAPEQVLDQPHPLVSGPDRESLASGARSAGIAYVELPTAPELATVRSLLDAVEARTGAPSSPVWANITDRLDTLEQALDGLERPRVLFLFPAGLTAGTGTDVDTILELAGARNVASEAGLEGYRQISEEAIRRIGVDRVIATATMRTTPAEVASKPFLSETAVAGNPERVLVVDPSRTTRVGPYVDEGSWMLASWLHEPLPGPTIHAEMDRSKVPACSTIHVNTDAPNATIELLGERLEPGDITVPSVPSGHYRLRVHAHDTDASASIDLLLSVEGTNCNEA